MWSAWACKSPAIQMFLFRICKLLQVTLVPRRSWQRRGLLKLDQPILSWSANNMSQSPTKNLPETSWDSGRTFCQKTKKQRMLRPVCWLLIIRDESQKEWINRCQDVYQVALEDCLVRCATRAPTNWSCCNLQQYFDPIKMVINWTTNPKVPLISIPRLPLLVSSHRCPKSIWLETLTNYIYPILTD